MSCHVKRSYIIEVETSEANFPWSDSSRKNYSRVVNRGFFSIFMYVWMRRPVEGPRYQVFLSTLIGSALPPSPPRIWLAVFFLAFPAVEG